MDYRLQSHCNKDGCIYDSKYYMNKFIKHLKDLIVICMKSSSKDLE